MIDPSVDLLPGDLFFYSGNGVLSRLARALSYGFGERRTVVNHVAMVVEAGPLDKALVVESRSGVDCFRLMGRYRSKRHRMAIFRPMELTAGQRAIGAGKARHFVSKSYPALHRLWNTLDRLLLGMYLFRRLGRVGPYPIMSWAVSAAFRIAGEDFGMAGHGATTDDMWDYVTRHPAKFRLVWDCGNWVPSLPMTKAKMPKAA